jgi:hypothetical protein
MIMAVIPLGKKPKTALTVKWMDEPEEHDYAAAQDYLSLLINPSIATDISMALKANTKKASFKAKDILRASGYMLLSPDNPHVLADIAKINTGAPLSPILLVRTKRMADPLIIADGYHRVCAVYYVGEDVPIPCRIH